jgi:OLD-like protein
MTASGAPVVRSDANGHETTATNLDPRRGIPQLARALEIDLDKEGSAVHGTHFSSYVRFCTALSLPWALITDGDVDSSGTSAGAARAADLLVVLLPPTVLSGKIDRGRSVLQEPRSP